MDNAATSMPKAPGVVAAMTDAAATGFGNTGRGSHGPALAAARAVFHAREALARFLGMRGSERLCFTKNATEAINAALFGWLKPGMTVMVSPLEHNAVMRPLASLAKSRGIKVVAFGCSPYGEPDWESVRSLLADGVDLALCTAASNVNGAVLPLADLAHECAKAGTRFGVDASQLVGHAPFSAYDLGADFVCFPGHKGLLGPPGTGALYLKPGFDPDPLLLGGTGSHSESESMPEAYPDRMEGGTANAWALAGLGSAVNFLESTGVHAIEAREEELCSALVDGLRGIRGLEVLAPWDTPRPLGRRGPAVAVRCHEADPGELAHALGAEGLAIRSGLHCAPGAHRLLGTIGCGGTLRFSPGFFTADSDIREALATVELCARRLRSKA